MLKFLYYIFVNLDSVSMIFLKRAFYRKFKRINKRLIIFDNQDKLFVFFWLLNCFIFVFSLFYLEKFSLKIAELHFMLPLIITYFYFITNKILGNKYFPIYWLLLMIGSASTTICSGIAAYLFEGSSMLVVLQELDTFELSMITELLFESLHNLSNVIDNCSCVACTPDSTPKSPDLPESKFLETSPFLSKIYP